MVGDKMMEGNLQLNGQQDSHIAEVDVQSLPPGIYFLEAQSAENVFRGKFVKN